MEKADDVKTSICHCGNCKSESERGGHAEQIPFASRELIRELLVLSSFPLPHRIQRRGIQHRDQSPLDGLQDYPRLSEAAHVRQQVRLGRAPSILRDLRESYRRMGIGNPGFGAVHLLRNIRQCG